MILFYSSAFYLVKVTIAALFLIYACKLDLKERRVPNRLWKYMLAVFIPIDVVEYLVFRYDLTFALIQFAVMFAFSYFLYVIGAYGGADAKAFIVLAIAFPVYPEIWTFPLINKGFGVFAFSTLSNSVIFSPAILLYMFVRNVVREGLSVQFYYFIGYRVDVANVPQFHNLLEYIDENGKLVRLKRGVEPDDEMLQRLKKAKERGEIEKVWVTPGLPFLVFITIGFFVSVVLGDVLFEVISYVF